MSTSLKDLVPAVADDPPEEGRLVHAPEFDLTQIAKKLALTIPVFAAAVITGLKILKVETATDPPYVVAALGVTAAGLLALGIVSAADIVGRAYVEARKGRADGTAAKGAEQGAASELQEQETVRLEAAAQAARDAQDQAAEAERTRLDRLAQEERERLERIADDERKWQDRVAEETRKRLDEERQRLDRIADDERKRQDRVAEAERKRLDGLAEDERKRLDRAAEVAREE